jgi:hypothetical protein
MKNFYGFNYRWIIQILYKNYDHDGLTSGSRVYGYKVHDDDFGVDVELLS